MNTKQSLINFFEFNTNVAKGFMADYPDGYMSKEEEEAIQEHWNYELVDSYGGEDCGRDYWGIWRFTHKETGEQFTMKFDGWYASHYGSEYERCFEVKPKQKTITVYE